MVWVASGVCERLLLAGFPAAWWVRVGEAPGVPTISAALVRGFGPASPVGAAGPLSAAAGAAGPAPGWVGHCSARSYVVRVLTRLVRKRFRKGARWAGWLDGSSLPLAAAAWGCAGLFAPADEQ